MTPCVQRVSRTVFLFNMRSETLIRPRNRPRTDRKTMQNICTVHFTWWSPCAIVSYRVMRLGHRRRFLDAPARVLGRFFLPLLRKLKYLSGEKSKEYQRSRVTREAGGAVIWSAPVQNFIFSNTKLKNSTRRSTIVSSVSRLILSRINPAINQDPRSKDCK